MIRAVKFVGIPIRHQAKAVEFYTKKLGFSVVTDQPFDKNQRWIELGIPRAETRIVLFAPEGRGKPFSMVTFMSDDVVKTYRELRKKGVRFMQKPKREPWGIYAIFLDLEGNQFVLSSR